MLAAESGPVDWTQVLVVGIPILIVQLATVVIAILNHGKAADAQKQVAEVHRQTKPSNGVTVAQTVETTAREVKSINKELGEMRRAQGAFAATLGEHLADHDKRKR